MEQVLRLNEVLVLRDVAARVAHHQPEPENKERDIIEQRPLKERVGEVRRQKREQTGIDLVADGLAPQKQMLGGVANMLQGYAFALNRHNTFEDQEAAQQIQKAKVIMMERFGQGISPTDVADNINMGYSKFRRLFKEYTGYAPLQYIQELRLQRSKELLLSTNLSLTEIADEVGYDNADYFSTAFKKKNRITPAAYRKKLKN